MRGAVSTCYIDFVVVASFIFTLCFLLIFQLLMLPEVFYFLHYILGLKYYIDKYLNIL